MPHEYSRWTWDVMHAGTLTEVLRRAFLLAEAPPGGPTFVTVSKDLFEQRLASTEILPRARSRVQHDVPPPEGHVERIVESLLAAEAPALFLGNECIRHEISAEVAGIAEAVGAMVMLSVKIPCVFPNTHPNFVGEVLDDPDLLPGIDCFWSLGAKMFHTFNRPAQPLIKRQATILHTSLVPSEVGRNYPVDGAAIASIKATAGLVLKALEARRLEPPGHPRPPGPPARVHRGPAPALRGRGEGGVGPDADRHIASHAGAGPRGRRATPRWCRS